MPSVAANPLVLSRAGGHGIAWLCVTVFVLTGMPRLSLKFGPVPLYAVDILALITLYYAFNARQFVAFRRPFAGFVITILVFAVLGELGAVMYSGDLFRPLYSLARTLLAVSLFYSVSRLVQTTDDLIALSKAAALGIGITASLMIASSLPVLKGYVASYVFSISFLEPAAESTTAQYSAFLEQGTRGRSLVGVSILSGAFINICWPLVALLARNPLTPARWKQVALAASILAPFGVVMSYSRGAILGLIMMVAGLLFFGSGRSRRTIIVAVVAALLVFDYVGWSSTAFQFERVVSRTQAVFLDPYSDERESERILSYSEPFEHAVENPQFLFVGEGTSIGKTGVVSEQSGMANHAVFAQAYYSYGMIAAFVYVIMMFSALFYVFRHVVRLKGINVLTSLYYQALFGSLLGMIPWFMFGHAAVSTPRGAMLYFLVFGLIAAMRQVEYTELYQAEGARQNG